jgi:osmotically-inducible protein OsmY
MLTSGLNKQMEDPFVPKRSISRSGKQVLAAALAASALLGAACSSPPPKSRERERAGAATAERVYAALDANSIYYFHDVEVEVDDGVAFLRGYVWTTDELYHAQQIARTVPGVTGVRNEMELERQGNRTGGGGTGTQ